MLPGSVVMARIELAVSRGKTGLTEPEPSTGASKIAKALPASRGSVFSKKMSVPLTVNAKGVSCTVGGETTASTAPPPMGTRRMAGMRSSVQYAWVASTPIECGVFASD
jgi:hypothetical protein